MYKYLFFVLTLILIFVSCVNIINIPMTSTSTSTADFAEPKTSMNFYVREGAAGKADGSDWTNAFTALPAALVRDSTYYISVGTYGEYRFDDAEDGAKYIIVKKATAGEHGTDAGWDASYGGGQAHFTSNTGLIINFITGYYVFDGASGDGASSEGGKLYEGTYGFKLSPADHNRDNYLIGVPAVGYKTKKVRNVIIKHTALLNSGKIYGNGIYKQVCIYSFADNNYEPENIIISNNLLANSSSNMAIRNWKNCIIENNYFELNWSSPDNHGQQISPGNYCDDIILRNNIFKDSETFVVGCHGDNNKRWIIYNNIVIGGNTTSVWAVADSDIPDTMINWSIFNNTHVNVVIGGRGVVFSGLLSDVNSYQSFAYNNLFYNCKNAAFKNGDGTPGGVVSDYSGYFNCYGNFYADTHSVVSSSDPFVNFSGEDFHLKSSIFNGKSDLGFPCEFDKDGVKRGADGVWDIGAYEFK